MEQKKVVYMTPEEVHEIDPSMIDSVTMTTGSIIKILGESSQFKEEVVESNQQICEKCGLPKRPTNEKENIFRGKKQEEEIKVEEQTEDKKEVLRGPNGMPLLGDILSGNNMTNQPNNYNNKVNVPPVEKNQMQPQPVPPMIKPVIQPKPQVQAPIPKQIQPVIKPPIQKPIMPQPKGPLNPTVRPIIQPKPRIIPPNVIPPKVVVPHPNYKIKNNIVFHPGKKYMPVGPVFRNRKIDENQEEILCPDCSNEILCPDCAGEVLCPDCSKKDVICPDCAKKEEKKETVCNECLKKEEELRKKENERKNKIKEEERKNRIKENERKNKSKEVPKLKERKEEKKNIKKEGKDVNFDNYKYHEVNNKTEKNKKSQVIVKKEGIIIASHDE